MHNELGGLFARVIQPMSSPLSLRLVWQSCPWRNGGVSQGSGLRILNSRCDSAKGTIRAVHISNTMCGPFQDSNGGLGPGLRADSKFAQLLSSVAALHLKQGVCCGSGSC